MFPLDSHYVSSEINKFVVLVVCSGFFLFWLVISQQVLPIITFCCTSFHCKTINFRMRRKSIEGKHIYERRRVHNNNKKLSILKSNTSFQTSQKLLALPQVRIAVFTAGAENQSFKGLSLQGGLDFQLCLLLQGMSKFFPLL